MRRLIVIGALLLFSNTAFADAVNIKAQVDKDKITIGDRIRYEVTLEYDDSIKITPQGIAQNLGEFEINDYKIEEPHKAKSGQWVSKTTYIITTFTTGEFTIPPVKVKYTDASGKEKEVASDEIKINVESVKPSPSDKDDIRPLKSPQDIKGRFPLGIIISLVLLLVAGISAFIYFKRKKGIEQMPSPPPRPPEEIAKEALRALLEMKLAEKGMIKEYYIRLSDILRVYIEGRYRIFALDRTTWELYQEMRSKKIERMHVDKINDFLEDSDLVKFAKYVPTAREIEEIYKAAESIVETTTPRIIDSSSSIKV